MALVGGMAIDPGGETIRNSVILVGGSHVQRVGSALDVAVPSGFENWTAKDRFVVPAPVVLGRGVLMSRIDTLAEANTALIKAPEALEGIVSDADELPFELVRSLAKAESIVTPRLARLERHPDRLRRGIKNTKTLLDNRVRIASFAGPDALTEWRLLTEAGLTPREVLESATIHAARVIRQQDEIGSLRTGFRASLWILRQNPLLSIGNMSTVESILVDGEWQRDPGSPQQ